MRNTYFLSHKQLYKVLDKLSQDSKRVWIASPFLGKCGYEVLSPTVKDSEDVKLLTMFPKSIKSYVHPECLEMFWEMRSEIRTIDNLHAKLYIFDKGCMVTSANLTKKAFEQNYEAGIFSRDPKILKSVRNYFNKLWENPETKKVGRRDIDSLKEKLRSRKVTPKEDEGAGGKRHSKVHRWGKKDRAKIKSAAQRYYIVNTNIRGRSGKDDQYMLSKKRAAAFYSPWKNMINRLEEDDMVFLYRSGYGIVAFGRAQGKVGKRSQNGKPGEEHWIDISDGFRDLSSSPVSAAKIRDVVGGKVGKNMRFRHTLFELDSVSGQKLVSFIMRGGHNRNDRM